MKTKFNGILTLLLAFMVQFTFAQERVISGVVSDDMGPVADITVTVKGTTKGTVTDFDGKYSIKAKKGDTLVFSHISYGTVEKVVGDSDTINVKMKTSGVDLGEVVVQAYSDKKIPKGKTTAAITTVTSETIENRPNASVIQTMQGQISGLNIGTGSGQPGATSKIILRGVGSINGNLSPLIVMDGIPIDEEQFRSLNSSDISSVSVLKDASATSLYGSRAANGVIIIVTKRGKFNSPLKIGYKSQFGFSILPKINNLTMMNSIQRLNFERDNGFGMGNGMTDAEIQAVANYANTNWVDVITKTGVTNSHNITLSSGSDKTTLFTSLGYFEQEGVTRRSNIKKFNFRNNFDMLSENKKFKFGTQLTLNYSKNNMIEREGTGTLANPFLVPFVGLPYLSPYNLDGSLNIVGDGTDGFGNTPFVSLNNTVLNTKAENELKAVGGFNASYEFVKNITARYKFGLDYTHTNFINILHPQSIYGQSSPSNESSLHGSQGDSYREDVRFNSLTSLNYNNVFNEKHTLDLTLFAEYSRSFLKSAGFTAFGLNERLVGFGTAFTDGSVFENIAAPNSVNNFPYIPSVGLSNAKVGMFSYFGVARYDYDEKYGLDISLRRDASSRFAKSNRWGTFYSIAARWNIANETFMENSIFNTLKLRASYGTSGNDRITGPYYGALYNTYDLYGNGTGYNNSVAIYPQQIANTDLRWEKSTQLNIGLDFGIYRNKIRGTIDVYNKKTDDLFQPFPISSLNYFTRINANIGSMENKGIELSLNYVVINGDFKFDIFANASYNKNKILELPNHDDVDSGRRQTLSEGQPINSFYVVKWAGVNPEDGNNLYYDIDGNITETYSDANRVFVGKSSNPVYQGGFGFNSSYKGFSLNTQFSFVADVYRNNGNLGVVEDPTLITISNSSVTLLDAWQQVGDVTSIPSLATPSIRNLNTDRYIEDASFLRLRNITLGYSIPKKILPKGFFLKNINVFLQAENMFTWSKWRGWDPESNFREADFFDYPTPKIVTLGLEVKF